METTELFKSLIAFQRECPSIKVDASNPAFRSSYVTLTGLREATRDILAKHGLGVTQLISSDNGDAIITTALIHVSGQKLETVLRIAPEKKGAHGMGSAITYGRRYSYSAILGLVDTEDDDGNAATPSNVTQQSHQQAKPEAPAKAPEPQVAIDHKIAGAYVIKFGFHKGKAISQLNDRQIAETVNWAATKGSGVPTAREFLPFAKAWLARPQSQNDIPDPEPEYIPEE